MKGDRMRRYGYRSRRYKRSTNFVRMKFQSFMDISTKADEMQIITISAGGKNVLERLPAQFGAYKYYKLGNVAVKLVPASTLPVDPTGLSITAGDQLVDPRDQLTPGMMRITNGEDVFTDISGMDPTNQHQLYNAMMLDPRWYKWMLQSGVKRHATPRYWQIGQFHQDKWPGATLNVPAVSNYAQSNQTVLGTNIWQFQNGSIASSGTTTEAPHSVLGGSSSKGLFQVGHRGVLGWLPTDGMQTFLNGGPEAMLASPPTVELLKIILPPAYKTKYYYRMYITETVYFKDPVVMAMGNPEFAYRPLDVFRYNDVPTPALPLEGHIPEPSDTQTGGNYGGS